MEEYVREYTTGYFDMNHPEAARLFVFDEQGNKLRHVYAANLDEGWVEQRSMNEDGTFKRLQVEKTEKSVRWELQKERLVGKFTIKLKAQRQESEAALAQKE